MHLWLSQLETEQLYQKLLAYFRLAGASNVCQTLEAAWKDPTTSEKSKSSSMHGLREKGERRKPSQEWSKLG